jgi:hypothetical protein
LLHWLPISSSSLWPFPEIWICFFLWGNDVRWCD